MPQLQSQKPERRICGFDSRHSKKQTAQARIAGSDGAVLPHWLDADASRQRAQVAGERSRQPTTSHQSGLERKLRDLIFGARIVHSGLRTRATAIDQPLRQGRRWPDHRYQQPSTTTLFRLASVSRSPPGRRVTIGHGPRQTDEACNMQPGAGIAPPGHRLGVTSKEAQLVSAVRRRYSRHAQHASFAKAVNTALCW